MGKIFDGTAGFFKKHKVKVVVAAGVIVIGALGFALVQSRDTSSNEEIAFDPHHVHQFSSELVQATCGHGGGTFYLCECGYSYMDDKTPALEHELGEWKVIERPTPETPGHKEQRCLHCNYRVVEEIPRGGEAEVGATTEPEDTDFNELDGSKFDSRIKIWRTPAGKAVYEYGSVSVKDGRFWGDPPSIYIIDDDGFKVIYYKQDGTKVEFTLSSVKGYSVMCSILDDGTYKTSLVGDFND